MYAYVILEQSEFSCLLINIDKFDTIIGFNIQYLMVDCMFTLQNAWSVVHLRKYNQEKNICSLSL